MKTILVKRGEIIAYANVDDEDYAVINRYSWLLDHKGYAQTVAFGTTIKMHRLILNPSKNDQIDHINMNKLDNQKCNLRVCNNSLNQANTEKREYIKGKKTSSVYKGVHLRKSDGKWIARVSCQNKRIQLGVFDDEHDAGEAYNEKAFELWGEFARLNKIERG